ncbi:MAG TPA: YggT family protein [Actinomycetota bacterium]|nr:YggT family protein [Actinomycetota bacterium]
MLIQIVCLVLFAFWLTLFARIILSWFPPPRSGAGAVVVEVIFDVTEPVLRLVRGLLPPIRMGAMGLDLSPIIVFVALAVIRAALGCTVTI